MKKVTQNQDKNTTQASGDSNEIFRLIFENSSVGKSITGLDGSLRVNKSFCDMLGYSSDEMQKLNWMEITHPDDIEASKKMIENLINGTGQSARIEKRYIHKNGTIVWAAVNTYLQHNTDGAAQFFITNILDITHIKKTEEDLRLKNQAMISALNAIAIADLTGIITYVNPSFFRLWGYDNELDVIGRNAVEFWMLAEKASEVMIALQEQGIWAGELTGCKKDGSFFPVEVSANMVLNTDGSPVGMMASFRDITDRKSAEKALTESEQKYRRLFQDAKVGMYRSKLDGSAFLDVNNKFAEILGFSPEELIGTPGRIRWADPDERDRMIALIKTSGGVLTDYETRLIAKQGNIKEVVASITLFPEDGYFEGTMVDITERKMESVALQLSKERLLFATEGANLGVWNWDIISGELIWSDRCKTLFGIDIHETMSYDRFREALHPDDRDYTDKAVKDALDNHKDYDIEYRTMWPDGSIHWLAAKGRGYYDEEGKAKRLEGVVIDIHEQKMMVEALRENEERYKLANLATFNIIWDWDLQTNSLLWNDHFKTQFGYSAEEIEPGIDSWVNRIHPDDLSRVDYSIHSAIESGENFWNDQYRFICKNGKTEDVEDRGYIVRESNGQPLRMIGAMRVVTEHKQAEAKLKESLALLRIAGEASKLGGWSVNLEENRSYWSDEVAAIHEMPYGYAPLVEEGISFYAPEWREKITQVFSDCASKGIPYNEEMEIITATGKRVWVQTIGEAVRDETGRIIKVHGAFQDISERKQIEVSLHRYTERLRNLHKIDLAILQAIESPEAIAKTALQHIRELLNCQRASVGIFDLEKKNVQIFAANVGGKTIVQLGEILNDEVYGDIEILHQGKMEIVEDMTKVKVPSVTSRILQAEGIQASINVPLVSAQKLYGVLNVGWDGPRTISTEEMEIAGEVAGQITIAVEQAHLLNETKRYAAELEHRIEERTSQLLASNKELEAFSYSVSHDLRAPLRHISGYVELLLDRFNQNLPEKAQHYLNTISDSVGEMGRLIDDLLKFSRAGRMELNLNPINMQKVFDDALLQVKQANPNREIKWKISPLPEVTGDYNLLSMVWVNLLSNAVKFTRNRKMAKIEVGVNDEKSEFTFYIRDNGVGFDMQYAQKLFGVFQRLHSTAEFEGTGIGLANVRRTITRHDGKTWAEAEPDKGATFYFTLPKK